MKFIQRISIWYPPILASILYGIYVVSTNFTSPENFSWVFLTKSIVLFYAYLIFVSLTDEFISMRTSSNRSTHIFLHFLAGYLLSLAFGILLYIIVKQSFIIIYNQNDSIGFYHIFITSMSITVGYVLMFSTYHMVKSKQKQLDSELKKAEYQNEKLRLQYELLYNKLEPHFLFNNLNTLHSMIVESDNNAEDFVMSLSRVMRYSFQSQEKDLIAIEEELVIFDHYMQILQERVGKGLSYHVANRLEIQGMIVPMTLLNLLENVVKHNEVNAEKPIKITISIESDSLIFSNNLIAKPSSDIAKGDGLRTLKEMYKIRTGKQVLNLKDEDVFQVIIPLVQL